MTDVDDIGEAPWDTCGWAGEVVSIDGTATSHIAKDDVAIVIAHGQTPKGWEGETATVVQLMDGRYASWESWWDATGSGFCHDAYGGNAIVWFAATIEAAISLMSEKALELIRDQIETLR